MSYRSVAFVDFLLFVIVLNYMRVLKGEFGFVMVFVYHWVVMGDPSYL